MSPSRTFVVRAACIAGFALAASCGPARVPPPSVADLMEDRVALDGILLKCNRNGEVARVDEECARARAAIERLAHADDTAGAARRAAEFEKNREILRISQERRREQQESAARVDPYTLPVMPVEPATAAAPAAAPAPADGRSPSTAQTQ
jgi:hypothetical protein